MSTLDIILLICFIPATVQGLSKGFIRQIVGIAAVIGGAWAAFAFSRPVSGWIAGLMDKPDPKVISVVSFALISAAVIVALILVGNLLTKAIDHLTLGALNRFLGLVFSVIKTALILMLLIMLFEKLNGALNLVSGGTLGDSVIYGTLKDLSVKVFPFLKDLIGGFANV